MNTTHAPSSLYHRLLRSHLEIAGIAGFLLCLCLTMIAYVQHISETVADIRLPSSMASARVVRGIEASNSHLRSWVLLGSVDHIGDRQMTWSEQIEPAMNELDALADDGDLAAMAIMRQKMQSLKEWQWWVEDVAKSVGNDPARMIYERDLLPIYERIQRASIGLDGGPTDSRNLSKIQLMAAVTHKNLSEAVRQLSEAVRTGSVMEVEDFHDGSAKVQAMLNQLSDQVQPSDDARPLLDWILREYGVYDDLANQTIAIRQSDNWNRALYILRVEIEPLAREVKNVLSTLQEEHNALLQADVSRTAIISKVGSIVTLSMIFGLGAIAWVVARNRSKLLVEPIEALANASDQLANNKDRSVQLPVQGPREIAHLTERFNYMSRELRTRRNDLEHANRELQAYTHIITHDLKPPLINIKGHAGLIKAQLQGLEAVARDRSVTEQTMRESVLRTITHDIPDSVHFIDRSMAKMNTLIGGVLNNSRLLFRSTSFETVDMNELLEQVAALFSHRFDDIEFRCEVMPVIRTDSFLMEHIFSNLIDNALKYMDRNRAGRIVIGGGKREDEAHFFVRDNGIGLGGLSIDVFKLFAQANDTNKGAGVGLALVKTMLAKLGGRIWHEPNEEHGVTFKFCVPLDHEGSTPPKVDSL